MPSQVGICNLALSHLAATQIASLTEGSQEALSCSIFWETARDATLAAMHWSFARKRAELTQSSTSPSFGWEYQYLLPADFIEVVAVNEGTEPKWVIEGNYLLCDEDEIELVYISRVQDTGMYSPLFVDALAARLAADIAPGITRKFELHEKFMQLFEIKVRSAFFQDAAGTSHDDERSDMDADNDTWISVRS